MTPLLRLGFLWRLGFLGNCPERLVEVVGLSRPSLSSLRNQGLPKEDLWSSMDRARAPRVTEPLARAVLEHAKRSWGGVGRCVVIYHVRARVTDEKERHLPTPPHSSASAAIAEHGGNRRP